MKILRLTALALLVATMATPAMAIIEGDCQEKCTPTCPCGIQCTNPLGRTVTCGEAGYACTGFRSTGTETLEALLEAAPQSPADEAVESDLPQPKGAPAEAPPIL